MPRNTPPGRLRRFPGGKRGPKTCRTQWANGGCGKHICVNPNKHPGHHRCACGHQLAQVNIKEWIALGSPTPPSFHRAYDWDRELGWVSQSRALERSDYGRYGINDVIPYVPYHDVHGDIQGFIIGWEWFWSAVGMKALQFRDAGVGPTPSYADVRDFLLMQFDIRYEHACNYALRNRPPLGL